MNGVSQDTPANSAGIAGKPARPARIALVVPGLRAGGSEHVVTFVANQLVSRDHSVEIVNFEIGDEAPFYTPDPRVKLTYLARPIARRAKLDAALEMARRVCDMRRHFRAQTRDKRPDLIISFLTRTNVQTLLATRGLGIPVIVSERNNPRLQDPGPIWQRLRKWTYPMATGLVTMTRGAMECFPPSMRKRSWVIPNMAEWGDTANLREHDGKVLTAVGRLTHQKGFDLLLRAFARIADRHPDWRLRIWGEGPDRADLERLRDDLGLAGRAELPGVTDKPGQWIETADAFVLSSRFEGWGLVLGEAMAAGIPSVSFDCDFGPEDMITHEADGLLVKDGDIVALADELDRLIGDDALRNRLSEAASESSKRFLPSAIGQQWCEMIESVASERNSIDLGE